jgi:23S rRNA (adenine2503-C2)-methyltransferase
MPKPDLKNFTLQQLINFVESLGLSAYRGRQIFSWLYRPNITDFAQMTDLSRKVRELLNDKAMFSLLSPEVEEKSTDGTIKYGFRLHDGALIESVLIPEEGRHTLCVSSQVGCAMGCLFCLTGTMGFKRNLTPAEIVGQVGGVLDRIMALDASITAPTNQYINNLVFMGMGEPLANLDNIVTALDILQDQRGYNFSERRITVSTCGLVPRIKELGERTTVNLAISLHAVDDETRTKIMPINTTYPIEELLQACRDFPLPKRRRIMFEYILIRDLNDSVEQARILAKKLKGIRCKINLLPCNETPSLPYRKPSEEKIEKFQNVLRDAGYTAIIRSSRGDDISAACGQLAGKM